MNSPTSNIAPIEKALFTMHTHVAGGRHDGTGHSDDGQLDVKLAMPGSGKPGTNPEALFGADGNYQLAVKMRVDIPGIDDAALTRRPTCNRMYPRA